MNLKSHILLLLSCLYGITAFSQNIQFVENKGQWDKKVRFMGQVSNGAFFVHDNGFTVLQHRSDDLQRIHEALHDRTIDGKPAQGQTLGLHSHSYRVDFVGADPKAKMEAGNKLSYQ